GRVGLTFAAWSKIWVDGDHCPSARLRLRRRHMVVGVLEEPTEINATGVSWRRRVWRNTTSAGANHNCIQEAWRKEMDQIEAEDPAVQVALLGLTVILDRMEGVLAKIVYLSTLRDNKAGAYFHPSLSQVHGAERADRALAICHRDLFRWLVKAPVSHYVK